MASTQTIHIFPLLAVEDLQLTEIERIFDLTRTHDTDWLQLRASLEIPDDCKSVLDMIDDSVSNSDGKHEIALRLRLVVLLGTIHSESPDQHAHELTQIPISTKCRFTFEPVVYKGEKRCLRGFPDFSLWYSPYAEKENAAVNFIIMETKKEQSSRGISQALAYMGMIHAQRRYENRVQHDIFGLSTDNEHFHFLRINEAGQWSQLDMNASHRQEIVDTLAYIHKQASILSTLDGSNGSESSDTSKVSRSQLQMYHVLHCYCLTNDKGDSSKICWPVLQVDEDNSWTDESDEDDYTSDNGYED